MSDWRALLDAMVDDLCRKGNIRSAAIERAFRAVPRHAFLPGVELERVYSGAVIPTKFEGGVAISSSSEPAVMAVMLEQLDLEPGHAVLEIGAGTGYNAALLAELVGPEGYVVTIDIDEDICAAARAHLTGAGYAHVEVVCADGGHGYAPRAPYDRVEVTVGAADICPAWVEQLRQGGLITLPLWVRGHPFIPAFRREAEILRSEAIVLGGFLPMRGEFAEPQRSVPLGNGWSASAEGLQDLDLKTLAELLGQPPAPHDELVGPLNAIPSLFFVWQDARAITLQCSNAVAFGLFDAQARSLCVHAVLFDQPKHQVWSFGSNEMFQVSRQIHAQWVAAGRPARSDMTVMAHPSGRLATSGRVIQRRCYDLELRWGAAESSATQSP